MLYGSSPFSDGQVAAGLGLRPVMQLHSELIAVRRLQAGDRVGYGGTVVCPEPMPVGLVAGGYGDGYPRHAPSGTPVLVAGRRVPLFGRVSMDSVSVDLRTCPEARVGDPVVLWGEEPHIDEVAAAAATIAYEPLTQVTARVPLQHRGHMDSL
jgi:alanine racemase